MMNKIKLTFATALLVACVACSTPQVEKAKNIAAKAGAVTVASLPLMAKVVTAYGAPYADIVTVFAEAFNPDGMMGSDSEEDYAEDSDEDFSEYDLDDDGEVDEEFDEDGDGIPDDYASDDEDSFDEDADYSESDDDSDFSSDSLSAQFDVLQELPGGSGSTTRVLQNGDVLNANDNYKIQLGCNVECYAYVAQLDATGRMDPVFPSNYISMQNPLAADKIYSFPDGNNWFFLDDNVGLEQIHVLVTQSPRSDIDEVFEDLIEANENLVQLKKTQVEETMVLTRGIAGVRKGQAKTVELPDGKTAQYISTLFQSSGEDLVITRWFKHQ